jgi:hypothetical protein
LKKTRVNEVLRQCVILVCSYCRSESETESVNISITYNEDIIATDKQVIPIEHSVSNYSVTLLARYAGHAVVNFSLVDAVGDRYCISCYSV